MALTQAELQQAKFFLGYTNLLVSARPYLDIALVFEDVVQGNLDPTFGEPFVRNTILPNLTALLNQYQTQAMLQSQATELVGSVKIDGEKGLRILMGALDYWKDQLSLCIGVPRTDRHRSDGGPGGASAIFVT